MEPTNIDFVTFDLWLSSKSPQHQQRLAASSAVAATATTSSRSENFVSMTNFDGINYLLLASRF